VSSFSQADLNALYTDAFAVMTMFQSFPPISKQIILRLINLGDLALSLATLKSWLVANENVQLTLEAELNRLKSFNVIQIVYAPTALEQKPGTAPSVEQRNVESVKLHPAFRDCLLTSVTAGSLSEDPKVSAQGSALEPSNSSTESSGGDAEDEEWVPRSVVDSTALSKWAAILNHMVGVAPPYAQPSTQFKEYLIESGLMTRRTAGDNEVIAQRLGPAFPAVRGSVPSPQGVVFLLQPLRSQLWTLITGLVEDTVRAVGGRDDTLRFLFRLSFTSSTQRLPISALTDAQKVFLHKLAQIGVVYVASENAKYYYPTYLANALSDSRAVSPDETALNVPETPSEDNKREVDLTPALPDQRMIILETSMKVYAYTSSYFIIALLSIFVRLDFRLPNMVAGLLTRESVKRAFLNGLTAADIVAWLARHAHPKLVAKAEGSYTAQGTRVPGTGHIVPLNVAEQIQLWQEERHRLNVVEAFLVEDFDSVDEFEYWASFVRTAGMALYIDSRSRRLVLKQSCADEFKKEVLAWRARTRAAAGAANR